MSTHIHWTLRGAQAPTDAPTDLLVEVPHAAWRRAHYDALRARLKGVLPDQLEHFFHVNTDVGAEHLAMAVAEALVALDPSRTVELILCRIPRTLVDCNRRVQPHHDGTIEAGGMTPGLAPYIDHPDDRALLTELHQQYQHAAEQAHQRVGAHGGLALIPHTYAPRSVGIDHIGADIVERLHQCWAEPERWPLRAPVDLITTPPDGPSLADPVLVAEVATAYRALGLEVELDGLYSLHPASAAHAHSARFPGQVFCLELRRDLLLQDWLPFEEQSVAPSAVQRLAGPLVHGLHAALCRRRSP